MFHVFVSKHNVNIVHYGPIKLWHFAALVLHCATSTCIATPQAQKSDIFTQFKKKQVLNFG